jgi:hypothetical protein
MQWQCRKPNEISEELKIWRSIEEKTPGGVSADVPAKKAGNEVMYLKIIL